MIADTPYCFWGDNLTEDNIRFLKRLDSNYYHSVACKLETVFSDDQTSAILIRQLYFQSLECLFSMLFGYLQSPHYIIGWLNKYEPWQIRLCITKINNCTPIQTLFDGKIDSWKVISNQINAYFTEEKRELLIEKYEKLWIKLANEYINSNFIAEYNSLKHGNRILPGGVFISVGAEHEYGIAPPPEEMHSIGGSKYGSTFFSSELVIHRKNKINYIVTEHTVNWDPGKLIGRLCLISNSINNIRSCSLIANGESPQNVRFENPQNIEAFDEVFESNIGVLGFDRKCSFNKNDIEKDLQSPEAICTWYRNEE
jgi:hypothetical protein